MRIASYFGADYERYSLRLEKNFLYFFILVSGFFIVFPHVDIDVSRYFYRAGDFVIAQHPYWVALRDYHRLSQFYIIGLLLMLLLVYATSRRPLNAISPHKIVYAVLTFAFGPGVLVQTLKFIIGRARPRHLMEFGGTADFTPAWQFANACRHSCSFPSGESAAASAMLSLLILVPRPYRVWAAGFLVPLLVSISLNRVFMGAHFLSDVVIAWVLIIGLMIWLWPGVARNADTIDNWFRQKGSGLRKRLYKQID